MVRAMTHAYKHKILERIEKRSSEDATGCKLWKGAKSGGYGRIKVTVPGYGKKGKSVEVHSMVYFLTGKPQLPDREISHLCHNKLCIQPAHLSYEPPLVNKQRTNCKKEERCTGHGDRLPCIVMCFIGSSCM